ncbi:hypothetical protein L2E82_52271 [Cichorium intybus]|nr:hypothetical protein L2E82_52271 [Cichorium intybus]
MMEPEWKSTRKRSKKIQIVETAEDRETNGSVPLHARSVESRNCNAWREKHRSRRMTETNEEDSTTRGTGGIGITGGSLKDKPINISPKGGKEIATATYASGPAVVGLPDTNNSPKSSGCFPFIENDDEMDETQDLGEEDDLELTIHEEIEKKENKQETCS